MELDGSVIAITGGSSGFGLGIARELLARGARLGLVARREGPLTAAVAELGTGQALGIAADVSDKRAIAEALGALKKKFGRLDALVNNAGLARPNRVQALVEDEVMLQVRTNFLGTVFASQAAIPLLHGAPDPRIINISSASAWHYDEMSHLSIYAATKAAVERFSRDLREELQEDGIGVSCIRPGMAVTGFAEGWDEAALARGMEAWHRDAGPYMDAGMEVEQVAKAVACALEQPAGVAIDLLEIRPNRLVPKQQI